MVTVDALHDSAIASRRRPPRWRLAKSHRWPAGSTPRSSTSACPTAAAMRWRASCARCFAQLPIVIATGYGDRCRDGLGDEALTRFLGKPYDSSELTTILRDLGVRLPERA